MFRLLNTLLFHRNINYSKPCTIEKCNYFFIENSHEAIIVKVWCTTYLLNILFYCLDAEKGLQQCIVCKNESDCTRSLTRPYASQYGLREEDVPPGAKVCNSCRCKSVRSRYTHCSLPTCPNAKKGHRVKRLRPLPMKWPELPRHIRDPIAAELRKYFILTFVSFLSS